MEGGDGMKLLILLMAFTAISFDCENKCRARLHRCELRCDKTTPGAGKKTVTDPEKVHEEARDHTWTCTTCKGTVIFRGLQGEKEWGLCRLCGLEQYKEITYVLVPKD
jgi:hypothetical protein